MSDDANVNSWFQSQNERKLVYLIVSTLGALLRALYVAQSPTSDKRGLYERNTMKPNVFDLIDVATQDKFLALVPCFLACLFPWLIWMGHGHFVSQSMASNLQILLDANWVLLANIWIIFGYVIKVMLKGTSECSSSNIMQLDTITRFYRPYGPFLSSPVPQFSGINVWTQRRFFIFVIRRIALHWPVFCINCWAFDKLCC